MSGSREVKGKTHTYYQVLIDGRDIPHIVSTFCFFSPVHFFKFTCIYRITLGTHNNIDQDELTENSASPIQASFQGPRYLIDKTYDSYKCYMRRD